MSWRARLGWAVSLFVVTLAAGLVVIFGVRISPDVGALLPKDGQDGALASYVRAFGGSDPALILVRGETPELVEKGARELAVLLRSEPWARDAATELLLPVGGDPSLVFRLADRRATSRLAAVLTPEGMRARLAETRALLLAPGASTLEDRLRLDPLRLWQLLFDGTDELFAGGRARTDGQLATQDGRARLVVLWPRLAALKGESARVVADGVERALGTLRSSYPELSFGFTGGHAIAAATETMLRADLARSGALSVALSALAFVLTFRRGRALVALLPPLLVGTLWTASLAVFVPGGLSGIAVAFAAVVVGVGVDTGVHVYAALLRRRREGVSPREAAALARRETARPVLFAALAASAAFASLALSQVSAIRQLGLLCAAGEVLTAVAILIMLPEIGALLERGEIPAAARPGWIHLIGRLTATRGRAALALALVVLPVLLLAAFRPPRFGDAIFAVRPEGLAPLDVQREIYGLFGGQKGQWIVLVRDVDRERALERGDRLTEALAAAPSAIEGFDSLTAWLPSGATQRKRLLSRARLNLPERAADLESALSEAGFAVGAFAPALEAFRHPSEDLLTIPAAARRGDTALDPAAPANALLRAVLARHVADDEGAALVAVYVRPRPGQEQALEMLIRAADPAAYITGYARLEASLRASLAHDFPRIGAVSAVLVTISLLLSLRRMQEVALAVLVLAVEMAGVLALARVLGISFNLYDGLVLPALFGITIDEAIFLLERARQQGALSALVTEGPSIAATALTTSAGFAALLACRFSPLRDLGALGAMGSALGLGAAVIVIPAGLRWLRPPEEELPLAAPFTPP